MLTIHPKTLGDGWVQIPADQPLKTADQFMNYETGLWQIGSVFTSDGVKNPGRIPWRRAVSLSAKRQTFWPVVRKIWNRKVKTLFT